jgi:uncharacterized membrane protein
VSPDGTARVTESLTYTFDGRFSYAFRTIPLRLGDRVYDVEVAEGGDKYVMSMTEARGSYSVVRRADEVEIKWHYRAKNETRTFVVSYSVEGAVSRHADVVEFYLTLFSNGTGRRVGEVSAEVSLPGGMDPTDLRAFAHGPFHGTVKIVDGSTVRASVSPLPARRFTDVRVLAPTHAFTDMPVPGDAVAMLDRILAQEAQWAEQANRERAAAVERAAAYRAERERKNRLARTLLPVAAVLGAIALAVWFAFFRRHGWPHPVTPRAVPGQVPSDHPPAILSYLLARAVGGPAMVATLVDLSERGFLRIDETQRQKTSWRGKTSFEMDYRFDYTERPGAELRPFEKNLVDFMVKTVGNGRGFTMSQLKEYAKKHSKEVRKWYAEWNKEVVAAGKKEQFYEPFAVGAIVQNVLIGVAVLAAGIVISAATSSPAGVPAIAGGFLQAILSTALNRRTPEGRRLHLAWKQFKVHLKSLAKAQGKVSLASNDWARFLSAGILFGMHKKLLPALTLTDRHGRHGYPVWYHAVASSAEGGSATGIAGLADGLSAMVTSVTTTMSSSTGAGGGAAAGGGGGAGGGSAGAG